MKMKRIFTVFLSAVLFGSLAGCGGQAGSQGQSGNGTSQEEGNIDAQGEGGAAEDKSGSREDTEERVLRVGMEGTFAPYTYHDDDGTLVGYEVDVANAIGEKLGWKVEFVETEWDSMFEALKAGNFDVVMNQVTISEDREKSYDFSIPYIYSRPVLIVAADNEEIKSFDDIAGKKAAEGLTSNFNQIAQSYGAETVEQDEFALAMECVLSKEADLVINDELTYGYWKTVKGDDASTKIVAEFDDVNASAIVMEKGNTELKEKLDEAIAQLLEDGTIAEISDQYFSMDISQK